MFVTGNIGLRLSNIHTAPGDSVQVYSELSGRDQTKLIAEFDSNNEVAPTIYSKHSIRSVLTKLSQPLEMIKESGFESLYSWILQNTCNIERFLGPILEKLSVLDEGAAVLGVALQLSPCYVKPTFYKASFCMHRRS